MASTITLEGLSSVGGNEDRALADIIVDYNNIAYKWKIYIPKNVTNLDQFLEESKPSIESDIDAKELKWINLNPKTKIIDGVVFDIQKDEIVKPDVPDYYALRRNQYPSIGEQLDAVWKGIDSQAYTDMLQKIQDVKNKYPKPL